MNKKYLMNKDKEVLSYYYDKDNGVIFNIEVLNNDFLPYELKNYLLNSSDCDAITMQMQTAVFSDYLASRTLNLSRDNAKVILNIAALPQTMRTKDRLAIVDACRGLSMTDSFWIKDGKEDILYKDVNLRENRLSEASYRIAILGEYISATRAELTPDLTTEGMFPKFGKRGKDGSVYMYKTDNHTDFPNTRAEIENSRILKTAGVNCAEYTEHQNGDRLFAVSKCIADDEYSLVSMQSIKDYCVHTKQDFYTFIDSNFLTEFANMCVTDYVIANTDRHFGNFGVLVNNDTNDIYSFAPLFDHNQSLIADNFNTDIDNLIYEPTNKTFRESIEVYSLYTDVDFTDVEMSDKCKERWNTISNLRDKQNTRDTGEMDLSL